MVDCLFCRIIRKDIPASVIHEDDKCLAFQDINPKAPVHFLVIPKKHMESVRECTAEDQELLGHLLRVSNRLAQDRQIQSSGFRIVINTGADGGQTVFHLHLHLLGGREMSWPPG